jgi:hypothetical protein
MRSYHTRENPMLNFIFNFIEQFIFKIINIKRAIFNGKNLSKLRKRMSC